MPFERSEIFHLVGFGTPSKNHAKFLLFAKLDGIANISRAVGENQQGQLAANHRRERFQFQVAVVLRPLNLFHDLRIVARALEPFGDFVHLLFVLPAWLRCRAFLFARKFQNQKSASQSPANSAPSPRFS